MTTRTFSTLAATATLVLATASPLAWAQARLWNFGDQTNPGACTQTNAGGTNGIGNVYSCAEQGSNTVTMEARGYGLTSTGSVGGFIGYYGTTSGIGIGNANEGGNTAGDPNHAFDNSGTVDVLLLKFTSGPVALQTLDLGWSSGDSDVSIMRWNAGGTPDLATNSLAAGDLTGWAHVANISDAIALNPANFNAAGLTSSYWLIAAYNSAFGGSTLDSHQDNFKLLSVGSNIARAPEPATLLLAGLALSGGLLARRRRLQETGC